MTKLTEDELSLIQDLTSKLSNAKMMLGDLEMRKHEIFIELDALKNTFKEKEKELIYKYGLNSSINMQTGEVTKKE